MNAKAKAEVRSLASEVKEKYEDFLVNVLGATYVAVTNKKVGGVDTGETALVVGFEKKLPMSMLIEPPEFFMKMFNQWKDLGDPMMKINFSVEKVSAKLPEVLEGIKTDVIEHKMIRIPIPDPRVPFLEPFGTPGEHQQRFRPVPGGVSFIACESSACSDTGWFRGNPTHSGHVNCKGKPHYGIVTYGEKEYTGCWHILSNFHCFMNFNSGGGAFPVGHGGVQPSPYDGGICPQDVVAYRSEFIVPVRSLPYSNNFDAAASDAADRAFVCPKVFDVGLIRRNRFSPQPGDEAVSSSRTMGTTYGKVIATDVTITVNYNFFIASIKHCIQHSARIAGGSSGSFFGTKGAGENDYGYTGTNFAGADSPDQNYACSGEYICNGYGAEFDWVMRPDSGEPPEPPTCPPGQHWDEDKQQCIDNTPTCPPGQHWDESSEQCVDDPEPPVDCTSQLMGCLMDAMGPVDIGKILQCFLSWLYCIGSQDEAIDELELIIANMQKNDEGNCPDC